MAKKILLFSAIVYQILKEIYCLVFLFVAKILFVCQIVIYLMTGF